jgi:ATP-dependent helicase HrpB
LQISLALKLNESELRAALGDHLSTHRVSELDASSGALKAFEEERLLALVLSRRERMDISSEDRLEALKGALRKQGIGAIASSAAVQAWRARIHFARAQRPELNLPDPDDLEALLTPLLQGKTRLSQVSAKDHLNALKQPLDYAQTARLDALFPTHLTVASGSRKALDYSVDEVKLEVKLQELFGQTQTPTINDGRTIVTLHLLSPGHRPIQVTRDLKGFWERTYAEVKRELKGRYPRHPWPDDPLNAMPTARAKPRGT